MVIFKSVFLDPVYGSNILQTQK